jgi:hypothetical protein
VADHALLVRTGVTFPRLTEGVAQQIAKDDPSCRPVLYSPSVVPPWVAQRLGWSRRHTFPPATRSPASSKAVTQLVAIAFWAVARGIRPERTASWSYWQPDRTIAAASAATMSPMVRKR